MARIECLRRWNNLEFSLECTFEPGSEVVLDEVHGLNCDANAVPQYVIDAAFAWIEEEYENGVSVEEIAKSTRLLIAKPRSIKADDLMTFEIKLRYTCSSDFGTTPDQWKWYDILDITPGLESFTVDIQKVETTQEDYERHIED